MGMGQERNGIAAGIMEDVEWLEHEKEQTIKNHLL